MKDTIDYEWACRLWADYKRKIEYDDTDEGFHEWVDDLGKGICKAFFIGGIRAATRGVAQW